MNRLKKRHKNNDNNSNDDNNNIINIPNIERILSADELILNSNTSFDSNHSAPPTFTNTTSKTTTINNNTIFTSFRVKRLEELKRHQQNVSPVRARTRTRTTSISASSPLSSIIQMSPIRSPKSPTNNNTINFPSSTTTVTSWNNNIQLHQLIEEMFIYIIQNSFVLMIIIIISLLLLLYILISPSLISISSFIHNNNNNMLPTQLQSILLSIISTIKEQYNNVIIISSSSTIIIPIIISIGWKLVCFYILYSMILDIIFIGTFDNVNIPFIVLNIDDHYNDDVDEEEEKDIVGYSGVAGNSDDTSFIGEQKNDHPTKRNYSPKHQHHHHQLHKQIKNPIIRSYVIEKIQQGTTKITQCIMYIGIMKGLICVLYHGLSLMRNVYGNRWDWHCSHCRTIMRMGIMCIESVTNGFNFIYDYLVIFLQWVMSYEITFPLRIIAWIMKYTIIPLMSGFFSLLFMTRIYLSSMLTTVPTTHIMTMNANEMTIQSFIEMMISTFHVHCFNMIQSLMMYVGVFMLVFYVIVCYCYPQNKRNKGHSRVGGK